MENMSIHPFMIVKKQFTIKSTQKTYKKQKCPHYRFLEYPMSKIRICFYRYQNTPEVTLMCIFTKNRDIIFLLLYIPAGCFTKL